MIQVEIDRKSGFCFGVQNAVEIAEKALLDGEKVYSLGHIVHNDMEVHRLSSLGLESIDHDQFRKLKNCKVLIRAHGEPPETYRTAAENNITIIEATCPIVRTLQSRIRNAWSETENGKMQVVIYGKPGHAEVIGLLGQIQNKGILVTGPNDVSGLDFTKPLHLFSQTTMSKKGYDELANALKQKYSQAGVNEPEKMVTVHRTICGQVSNREPHLKEFAKNHEVIIFVSGRESSNGKMLYNICKSVNPSTYFVSSEKDIDRGWFAGKKTTGVCGATSTPKWLIESIGKHISSF